MQAASHRDEKLTKPQINGSAARGSLHQAAGILMTTPERRRKRGREAQQSGAAPQLQVQLPTHKKKRMQPQHLPPAAPASPRQKRVKIRRAAIGQAAATSSSEEVAAADITTVKEQLLKLPAAISTAVQVQSGHPSHV